MQASLPFSKSPHAQSFPKILSATLYDIDEPSYQLFSEPFPTEEEPLQEENKPYQEYSDLKLLTDFTDIYNRFFPFASSFARNFVSREDAEDIVSAIFTNLLVKEKQFKNLDHAKAFFLVSVKNACLTHFRTQSNRTKREVLWVHTFCDGDVDMGSEWEKKEISAEKMVRLYYEIERLPPRCKKVFKLTFIHQLKTAEIARLLGTSASTVNNQKNYAVKILRMNLISLIIFLFVRWLS